MWDNNAGRKYIFFSSYAILLINILYQSSPLHLVKISPNTVKWLKTKYLLVSLIFSKKHDFVYLQRIAILSVSRGIVPITIIIYSLLIKRLQEGIQTKIHTLMFPPSQILFKIQKSLSYSKSSHKTSIQQRLFCKKAFTKSLFYDKFTKKCLLDKTCSHKTSILEIYTHKILLYKTCAL